MRKIINISVGIPAYNESANIKKLLRSIISQKEIGYELLEVIVVSDGSTDKTDEHVLEIKNTKIKLLKNNRRMGKSACIDKILNEFKGDVLFLLDGDIIVNDKLLFSKIIQNNDFKKSGLIGINARPMKPKNYFQRVINSGFNIMSDTAKTWNKGQNYLSFKGCFLGLDNSFAKKIQIDDTVINNDAYFYFKAKDLRYSPKYYGDCEVYFKSPMSFSDHVKQNARFKNSKDEMQTHFNKDLSSEYGIPAAIYLRAILKNVLTNPYYFMNYLVIKLLTDLKRNQSINYKWNIALSTKN